MTDILSSKELDDEQKARLYNQVLQRFLICYDHRKGQPLHVKISTLEAVETPKPEENEQPTEEPAPEKIYFINRRARSHKKCTQNLQSQG